MNAFQLVANGTEINTRKNKNIISKKIFTDESAANSFIDEFYCICTNPIGGESIHLDPEEDIEINFLDVEIVFGSRCSKNV